MNIVTVRHCGLAAVAVSLSLVVAAAPAEAWTLPVSAAEIRAVADDAFDAGRYAAALGEGNAGAMWPNAVGPHVSGDPSAPSLPGLIARARP